MKPICVPCRRFYRPKRNGIAFIEGMPKAGNPKAGNAEPDQWQPYKLWYGDSWACPDCGAEIIVGAGLEPISEHYKENFEHMVKVTGATLQINDC